MNNNRTTSEQQVNTNKNVKNVKNVRNNISDSAEPETPKKVKHKYGEYNNVLLTDEELDKLKKEYPDYLDRIERLSSYVESTGKKYKSHYATIKNWAKNDVEKQEKKETVTSGRNKKNSAERYLDYEQRQYSVDEMDELESKLLGVKTANNIPTISATAENLKR